MAATDLAFHLTEQVALNTQVINSDTTTAGVIIDMTGFESATFVLQVGVVTNGDVTPLIEDDDAIGFPSATAVDDDFLIGTEAAAKLDTSQTVSKIGYVGKEGFVRLSAVTDNSADLTVGSVVILEHKRHNSPIAAAS